MFMCTPLHVWLWPLNICATFWSAFRHDDIYECYEAMPSPPSCLLVFLVLLAASRAFVALFLFLCYANLYISIYLFFVDWPSCFYIYMMCDLCNNILNARSEVDHQRRAMMMATTTTRRVTECHTTEHLADTHPCCMLRCWCISFKKAKKWYSCIKTNLRTLIETTITSSFFF